MKPYYEQDGITIYHGDCREILPELSGISLVVTDPPYTFGLASTAQEGKAGGWGDLMNNAAWYALWIGQCKRLVTSHAGAVWVFTSWRGFPVLARASYEMRWPIESLAVWDKMWIGPGGQRGLRPSYEMVSLFASENFAIRDRGIPDIIREQWSSQRPNDHPAEKPVGLFRRLIEISAPTINRAVLDPFCGSGTCLAAAKDLGYPAIGIEIEERYREIADRRLDQQVLDLGGV